MATEKNPFAYEEDESFIPPEPEEGVEVLSDGSVEVTIQEEEVEEEEVAPDFMENIAEYLDKSVLEEIGADAIRKYKDDKESRSEWEQMFEDGFDLLGLKLNEAADPFEGACTAVHPLLIESAVKFQSKASGELFPSSGPIRTQIMGETSPEKEQQATRVREFMNFEITEVMPEYFEEFERLLFHLPLFGSAFKKVYYDASEGRPVSEFVPVDQFYVPINAVDLIRADRTTHLIYRSPKDLAREIAAGMYLDLPLPEASPIQRSGIAEKIDTIMGFSGDAQHDPEYCLLEQHCFLELPEPFEGPFALPYIVTIEEQSGTVLSIRRNWHEGDELYKKINHFVHYKFVPGFGFYGLGYIHFLGNLTMTATAAMRSLVDAGQFANLPGGFKARGVRIVGDNDPIGPGEFKEVEATGMDLNKSIIALPYKEPSQTLYNMLQYVAGEGQRFADTTDQVVNDSTNYGPVGTTLALLEASAKFFSAVHKRLHKSQRDEFRILAGINYDYLPDRYPYEIAGGAMVIMRNDFDGRIDVLPVSDPNIPSNAHRFALSQMVLQLASQAPPGVYDMREVHRRLLAAANINNIDQIMPPKKQAVPQSPMADIISVSQGMPIKAFPGQNHDAHIQFKGAFLSDPAQQQNPQMKVIGPLLQANISEHMLLKYQENIGAVMQQQGPVDAGQQEFAMAQAAQQLAQMQQMAAQGAQQGSLEQQSLDIQKMKVQLEQQEVQQEAVEKAADMMLRQKDLELRERKLQVDAVKSQVEIDVKANKDEEERQSKLFIELLKLMAKAKEREATIPMDNIVVEHFPILFESADGRAVTECFDQGGMVRFAEGSNGSILGAISDYFTGDVHDTLKSFGEDIGRDIGVLPEEVILEEVTKLSNSSSPVSEPIVRQDYEAFEKPSSNIDIGWIQQDGIEGTLRELDVPAANISKSGATIASGFDVGQHSEEQLKEYFGENSDLFKKLKPFVGLKGKDAENKIKEFKDLKFTDEEITAINETIYPIKTESVARRFNKNSQVPFYALPPEFQTVIASVGFQYGDLESRTPKFYEYITTGEWDKALAELKDFKDDYGPRRKKEATLFEQGLKRMRGED
jgi:hypothetical protein